MAMHSPVGESGDIGSFAGSKDNPDVIINVRGKPTRANPPFTDEDNANVMLSTSRDGDNMTSNEAIDIIVYFSDNSGVQLKVRDGQNIEAGELFELVMDEIKYPPEAREAFSLWLVSDLLELQLKPGHIPFKLVCYWEELLEKYTTAPEEHQQRDEPMLMFKRNVFYSRQKEQEIEDPRLLRLLYFECKKNILDGRYPIIQSDCDRQAAIQAAIAWKELTDQEEQPPQLEHPFGSVEYFKSKMADYLPPHQCKRRWIYKKKENPERRLHEAYNAVLRDEINFNESIDSLYKKYLGRCWELSYYGAAFFPGQAEHPLKGGIVSKMLSTKDDPVYVAVNVDGVFIVDMDDVVLLIGFYYEKLSWHFAESCDSSNPNCLPCLFLQFPFKLNDNSDGTKLLQIFSRGALLMDNIIEACVELKKIQRNNINIDKDVVHGVGNIAEAFSRLALKTFDGEQKLLDNTTQGRKPSRKSANTNPNV